MRVGSFPAIRAKVYQTVLSLSTQQDEPEEQDQRQRLMGMRASRGAARAPSLVFDDLGSLGLGHLGLRHLDGDGAIGLAAVAGVAVSVVAGLAEVDRSISAPSGRAVPSYEAEVVDRPAAELEAVVARQAIGQHDA